MKQERFDKYYDYIIPIWNKEKNGDFTPLLSSRDRFFFLCEKNPSLTYEAKLSSIFIRAKKGWSPGGEKCVCPICKGKIRIPGHNDLFTLYPELEKQWSDNNIQDPLTVSFNEEVEWVCPVTGGKWKSQINERIRHGKKHGFKSVFVTGARVLAGYNDIATTHPHVLQWWNYEKNDIDPTTISSGSDIKAWWVDSNDNSYQMTIYKKCICGQGSPFDAGKKIAPGNSLAELYPELAKQWNYEKNGDLTPYDVTTGSSRQLWWICPETGKTWKASPKYRVKSGHCKSPYMTGKRVLKGYNDLGTFYPEVCKEFSSENDFSPYEVVAHSRKRAKWVCNTCLHEWEAVIDNRTTHGSGCPHCFNAQLTSRAEREVAEYVVSLLGDDAVETSNRSIINPYELDIYIPDHNLAIEFNGLYWHTENQSRDKRYHYNKWKQCKDKGIQLITIWEDEWRDKQDIVKSMLAHKLGVSHSPRVYARKTTLHPLESLQARSFLDSYHIQGFARSTAYFGLYDSNNTLVAVSSWRKNKNTLYLDRYATSCSVIGGMGKMLKKGKEIAREYGCTKIVTFADHQVSTGLLYEKLGFSLDKELSPDYRYLVDEERKHKFGYRMTRFKNDPYLKYKEGLTESQLAKINGIKRIWDCGKSRYIINI